MPFTLGKLLLGIIALALMGAAGAFLLAGTHDQWVQGQFLLTRRRVIPRLVTYAANPTEFTLRCLFLGSMGAFFASTAFAGAVGLIHRITSLRQNQLPGPFQSRVAMALMLVPLVCFLVWFGLLAYLPAAYD